MAKRRKKKWPVKGLEQLGPGSWRWSRMIDGKRHRVTFQAPSADEAIAQAMRLEKRPALVTGAGWDREVARYLEEAETAGKLSKHYAGTRRSALLLAGNAMELETVGSLTPARVRAWYLAEVERTKAGTAKHYLLHLRGFAKWAVRQRLLHEDPTGRIELPSVQGEPRQRFLPVGEVSKVLEQARAEGDAEMELLLLLGFEVGMRRGEISSARAEWVDLERGLITIPAVDKAEGAAFKRKGLEGRRRAVTVPMTGAVREWFERNGLPAPYLLRPDQAWNGGRYRYDFRERFARFMERAKVADFTAHDMRRSFGSNRVSEGVSLEKVANWMGISPATAWKHYARFIPADREIERGASGTVKNSPGSFPGPAAASIESRLERLKELEGKGLVSPEQAAERRREILGEL